MFIIFVPNRMFMIALMNNGGALLCLHELRGSGGGVLKGLYSLSKKKNALNTCGNRNNNNKNVKKKFKLETIVKQIFYTSIHVDIS